MPKLLLVEDDKDLAAVVKQWLLAQNMDVDVAHDGREGYEFLRQGNYDVAILDWDVPGMTGLEICRAHRSNKGNTPILMLTGKAHIEEKEAGLDSGADDYLTKPFQMRELIARLKALSRRTGTPVSIFLEFGNLKMDPIKHKLMRDGVEVRLLPRDFALLEFLMRHPDEVFSTDALLQRVWSLDSEVTPDAVRTAIKRLRKKLDESEDESASMIENVRRIGYRLRPKT